MLVREIVERYKKKRPISLMARMALSRLLAPQAVEQVFHDHAQKAVRKKDPLLRAHRVDGRCHLVFVAERKRGL